MEKEIIEQGFTSNRRRFLSTLGMGIGSVALGSLLMPDLFSGSSADENILAPAFLILHPKPKGSFTCFRMELLPSRSCLTISQCFGI